MKNTNQKLNATLSKKIVAKNGKTFTNLLVSVVLNNGRVVNFEIQPKFYNSKLMCLITHNIDEVK